MGTVTLKHASALFVAPAPGTRESKRYPGVVLIHDITGAGDDLRENAERIAAQGYLVLAPDLYSNGTKVLCVAKAVRDLTLQRGPAIDTLLEARTWLTEHEHCTGAVGVVGFCMGGGFALLTAAKGFDAAAPFYGVVPARQSQALSGACPVVASFGGRDPMLPGGARRLRKALDKHGVVHDIKTYPGVGHSFANKLDVGVLAPLLKVTGFAYDERATADAWERVFAFFTEHLADA